jgi:hypothetical protein
MRSAAALHGCLVATEALGYLPVAQATAPVLPDEDRQARTALARESETLLNSTFAAHRTPPCLNNSKEGERQAVTSGRCGQ